MTTMTMPIAHADSRALIVPDNAVQPLHTVCIPPAYTARAEGLQATGRLDDRWRELGEMSDEAGGYTTFVACLTRAGTIQYGIEIQL